MNQSQSALTNLVVSLLVVGICIVGMVAGLLDTSEPPLLILALSGAVTVVTLARPFPRASAAATLGAALYVVGVTLYRVVAVEAAVPGAQLSLTNLLRSPELTRLVPITAFGVFGVALVGFMADEALRRLERTVSQLAVTSATVEELTLTDTLTGAVKVRYFERLLAQEIERSRRYRRHFTLVLVRADDWEGVLRERGQRDAGLVLKTTGETLIAGLRGVDIVARGEESRFLLILPETDLPGAHIVTERLCRDISDKTGVRHRAGLAEFPTDAVSRDELMSEAEATLTFARTADLTIASSSLLR